MKTTNKTTIGEIVAYDFRAAAIFSKYNIDFCCKGHRTLKEVCKKRGIAESLLIDELDCAKNNLANQSFDYKSWSVDLLADYIEKTHHRYVAEKTPVLRKSLNELCTLHGEANPELFEILTLIGVVVAFPAISLTVTERFAVLPTVVIVNGFGDNTSVKSGTAD